MNGATVVVKDEGDENINKEIICDTLDLAGKLNDAFVDLECSSPLYGDLVELRVEKKDSGACIHMFEIESYAVELECPEDSVVAVSEGKCGCVSAVATGEIYAFLLTMIRINILQPTPNIISLKQRFKAQRVTL